MYNREAKARQPWGGAHVADRRSIDVDFAAREKGVVDEGEGNVVDHVPGLAVPLNRPGCAG